MANSLGNAAHALDGDVSQLTADLASYLAAGGSPRAFFELLLQKVMQTDGYTVPMTAVILKGRKGRPSPAATANATFVSITANATYP